MDDFWEFRKALSEYLEEIQSKEVYALSQSYDCFYEKIKDLDCYDFRFFYFKAHYLYKKLGKV